MTVVTATRIELTLFIVVPWRYGVHPPVSPGGRRLTTNCGNGSPFASASLTSQTLVLISSRLGDGRASVLPLAFPILVDVGIPITWPAFALVFAWA